MKSRLNRKAINNQYACKATIVQTRYIHMYIYMKKHIYIYIHTHICIYIYVYVDQRLIRRGDSNGTTMKRRMGAIKEHVRSERAQWLMCKW